jgi:hypothetical protein
MKISHFDMTQMLFHAQSAQELLPPEFTEGLEIADRKAGKALIDDLRQQD